MVIVGRLYGIKDPSLVTKVDKLLKLYDSKSMGRLVFSNSCAIECLVVVLLVIFTCYATVIMLPQELRFTYLMLSQQ